MKRILIGLVVVCASAGIAAAQGAKRPLSLDDLGKIKEVRDPQCAPDGKTVAFVVSQIDVKEDKPGSGHVWTVGIDGRNERQLTTSADSESSPRFSPDGKYLSFTSSRPGTAKGNQVWLLDRSGGEAFQLTEVKGRLQGYEWSPDSKRLALVVGDPDPDAADPSTGSGQVPAAGAPAAGATATDGGGRGKAPKPIVIDRYKYKQDVQGYLLSGRHTYVYLFDIATKSFDRLTKGKADESSPSWSPDGARLAFMSNRAEDPDREPSSQLFVVDARKESTEKALTPATSRGGRGKPEWSADGKWIAFLEGDDKKYSAYGMEHLTLVASDGSSAPARVKATEDLDRGVGSPRFSADGKAITVLVTDDRSVYPVRITLATNRVEKLMTAPVVVSSVTAAGGCMAALSGGDAKSTEVYRWDGANLAQLSRQNDALFAELQLGTTDEVSAKSKDGTEVHGLLTKPANYVAGSKMPMLLRIHGGPNGQDQHAFAFERQWFAANGYAVLTVNYRGSSGRGAKFSKAIAADWGHFEVDDLQAMVDQVVKMGVADPNKLGVGGWSYGGILTDYMIASDTRFKAATSGAGTAFTVAFYGTDQYIIQYDYEIGPPWDAKAWETYQKISYPFLHADRIKTPTLFLGGEKDFNVPVQGGQQMYQALRSLNIDTQLVIYPNEFHGITRPSYVRDRYERYLAWYDLHINGKKPVTPTAAQEKEQP